VGYRFRGRESTTRLRTFLAICGFFVHPSRAEGTVCVAATAVLQEGWLAALDEFADAHGVSWRGDLGGRRQIGAIWARNRGEPEETLVQGLLESEGGEAEEAAA
jgi:hypothetical protein